LHDSTTTLYGAGMDRLSVAEAAARLGMTEDGVRKRIHRNQIEYELDEDGRYFVYLDLSDTREDQSSGQSRDELVDELRDRIHFLENELSRERDAHGESRRIVAALVSRVPELEAPREMRESPVTDEEEAGSTSVPAGEEGRTSQPWWRRMFGG